MIEQNETNQSTKKYMLHTLGSLKLLIEIKEYKKATCEMQKVLDLIGSTYQTDNNLQLPNNVKGNEITREDCQLAIKVIMEIYSIVMNAPHKQYQTENRTITISLTY